MFRLSFLDEMVPLQSQELSKRKKKKQLKNGAKKLLNAWQKHNCTMKILCYQKVKNKMC